MENFTLDRKIVPGFRTWTPGMCAGIQSGILQCPKVTVEDKDEPYRRKRLQVL